MPSEHPTNPLDDRRKAQEEEYFRKQNQEAAEKLKARLGLESSGIDDKELVAKLAEAGFDSDSSRALYMVPLVEVAWADGKMQGEERTQILSFARERGIDSTSKAYGLVEKWLNCQPSDNQYELAKSLIGPIVAHSKSNHPEAKEWVLKASQKVAEATGGLFGFGFKMVSKDEAEVIDRLSKKLK
ncbi:MAG: hypothetical protein COV44_03800 [Deltaproteobacteria bacterium CG11_big_fil_rev_8_21_14_0_20_45_16]|nr:MAG: hypothetical protein COV44_03800 [Deltaproteobacteria bacterium CG11_big_fil_rev_8_21_14_0_20_45_16]